MSVTSLTKTDDGRCLVVLAGEVDLAVAPELLTELEYAVSTISPHLLLDVGAVEFIDSSGLSALVSTHRRAVERGGSLVLTGAPEHITDLLQLTRLDAVLSVEPEPAAEPGTQQGGPPPEPATGREGFTDAQRRAMLALDDLGTDATGGSESNRPRGAR